MLSGSRSISCVAPGRNDHRVTGRRGARPRAPNRCGCDVWAFDAAIDQGRPADALALYRGELLAGFHISDAPDFEHWMDEERSRLRQRAGEAGWALAE